MNFGYKIRQLRDVLNLTQTEFADKLNKSMRAVQVWESGKSTPPLNAIKEMAAKLNVSETWLLTGEGEMFKGEKQPVSESGEISGLVHVPYYDTFRVSAGTGLEVFDEEPSGIDLIPERFLKKGNPKYIRCLKVSGYSMSPRFDDGDYIFVDISEHSIQREGIYVIRVDELLLVKLVQWLPDGLKLISEHKEFEPIILKNDYIDRDVQIIGRVIAAITNC